MFRRGLELSGEVGKELLDTIWIELAERNFLMVIRIVGIKKCLLDMIRAFVHFDCSK